MVGLVSRESTSNLDTSNIWHIVAISNNASSAESPRRSIGTIYRSWRDNAGRPAMLDIVQIRARVRIGHGLTGEKTTTMMI